LNRPIIILIFLLAVGLTLGIRALNQTEVPQYGFAVFGETPEVAVTKSSAVSDAAYSTQSLDARLTARFIVLGTEIYFDQNENQLPERSEKFTHAGSSFELISEDGTCRYRLLKAILGLSPDSVSKTMPQQIMLRVEVENTRDAETITFQQAGMVTVYPEPINGGWAHFGGPLEMEFVDPEITLPTSAGPSVDLRLAISTPPTECIDASGEKTRCSNLTSVVPGALIPTATIEFPTSSDQTITKRYDLDQFC
jgi:hypothetical protein